MLCVVLQHGVFHFIVSIFLLHLTFAAETAVFLVACLAFLASFAALLVHRKRGSYPCLPFTLSLSQHCKSFPRSGMECIPADFSSIFTIPWGDFYRDSRTVCDKNTMEECKKRSLSAATISCQDYSVLHTNIQIKSKQKTHKKSYKTRSSPRV